MKTLKLKMKDLTNPTILTHHEIKNIMGGDGSGSDSGSGSTIKCKRFCYHTKAPVVGVPDTGDCSNSSFTFEGRTFESCDCSIADATSCLDSGYSA